MSQNSQLWMQGLNLVNGVHSPTLFLLLMKSIQYTNMDEKARFFSYFKLQSILCLVKLDLKMTQRCLSSEEVDKKTFRMKNVPNLDIKLPSKDFIIISNNFL